MSFLAAPAFAGPGAVGAWTLLALAAATAGATCGPLVPATFEPRLPSWAFAACRAMRLTDPALPVLRLRSVEDQVELRRRARLQAGLVPQD